MLKQFRNFALHDVAVDPEELLYRTSRRSVASSSSSTSSINLPEFQDSALLIVDDGHPLGLGNPSILRALLKHLTIKELFRVRLVNLRWNAIACEILRRRQGHLAIRPSQMKAFTKLMRKNITNPFCSYALRIDKLFEHHTIKFFNSIMKDIVVLRVRLNITEFLEFSRLLQKMTNLQQLHVILFDETPERRNPLILNELFELPTSGDETAAWQRGLYSFSKVHILTFENADASYQIHAFYDKILTNLLNACCHLKSLRFIHWNSPLGKIFAKLNIKMPGTVDTFGKYATENELITLFFNTNIKFKKLRLEVHKAVSFELVTDILHKCGDSLDDMCIINENIFERFAISSVLRYVSRLRLNLWLGPVDFTYMARQFPTLRVLTVNLSNLFELEKSANSAFIEPCTTLRTLILTKLETGIDASTFEKLPPLFPNVRELFVEVQDGNVLRRIYELYPQLTLLCIELKTGPAEEEPTPLTNQYFTGVPDGLVDVVQIRDCGCPCVEFPEESRDCWNIGCLRNLTTLLLRVPNSIDNIALLEGISRLEKLENLVLLPFYYSDEEPTKWCLRSIADNFRRLKTLVTSTEIAYSTEDVQYLKKKMPKLVHRKKV